MRHRFLRSVLGFLTMSSSSSSLCTIQVVSNQEDIPTTCVDGKPTYVYWKILGLAQSARLALVLAGIPFVDVQIDADVSKDGWVAAKHTAEMRRALTFPNLPYFLHPDLGENKGLVQSDAILRFIGAKYDILGSSPAFTDMCLEHLHDAESTIARFSYGSGPDKILAWFKGSVPGFLQDFGQYLADKSFLSDTDKPSVADLKLYVFLYKLTVVQEQLGDDMTQNILGSDAAWIKEYMQRIEAIPTLKAFMASPQYMKGYMNNPSAKWRG